MLKKSLKVTLEGECLIDNSRIARFLAVIDAENPSDIILSTRQIDKAACKEHRDDLRVDEAAFEDYAYSIQDKMLADMASAQ